MTKEVPTDRVLSTLNQDGTRHWIHPKVARGRFWRRRRVAGFVLIALFVALPFITIGGRPAMLIDLFTGEVAVFGAVFRPTDGFVLMLLGLTIVLAVFLVTALFGRVWCGWGCPQTVYLEQVFRPIERWLEGSPAQRAKLPRFHPRRLAKWIIYAALSFVLANVFLAYFVGVDRLETWVLGSPLVHPGGFGTVVGVAGLMLFDFGYFREQTCTIACPYGRLQTVLLDKQSLIIGYNEQRGEPRAKPKKLPVVSAPRGDCVDCGACVAVCPTGIDIRNGLQMECIGCAQCIDACDVVMDKLSKPRKLIGYTSQDELAGKPRRIWRPRTILYPALLAVVGGMLAWAVGSRIALAVSIERVSGPSFIELPDGAISAQTRIKLDNQSDETRYYTISLIDSPNASLRAGSARWQIARGSSLSVSVFVDAPRDSFVHGKRRVHLRIDDSGGYQRVVTVTLLGPDGGAR